MMPILFEFDLFGWHLELPSYGFLLAVAFLAALWLALRQARKAGVDSNVITDIWIGSLISGVLGAKLLLYLLDLDYYLANPWAILSTLRSAGVWYGGLIAAVAASLIMLSRRRLSAWVVGDIVAPAIALGQAIGRWGCFAAGCCYGTTCSLPWAVTFTDERAHRITGVPLEVALHPTQLYLSAADFVLFGILMAVAARRRFPGQVLLAYLVLYAILRGTIEIFRGDPRGEVFGLSTSQAISIVVGIAALALYIARRGAGGTPAPAPAGRPVGDGRRKGGPRKASDARPARPR